MKVFEATIQGNPEAAYLLTGSKKAEVLDVETHGTFGFQDLEGLISLQASTPIVTIMGPHEEVIASSIRRIKKPYAKISSEGITLSSQQAKAAFETSGYEKITGSQVKGTVRNYSLSKLQTVPINKFAKHSFELISSFIGARQKKGSPIDALTLRKKAEDQAITAADILSFAEKEGYKEVIFNICRAPFGISEEERIYFYPRKTILLDEPIFKPWSELKRSHPTALLPRKRSRIK